MQKKERKEKNTPKKHRRSCPKKSSLYRAKAYGHSLLQISIKVIYEPGYIPTAGSSDEGLGFIGTKKVPTPASGYHGHLSQTTVEVSCDLWLKKNCMAATVNSIFMSFLQTQTYSHLHLLSVVSDFDGQIYLLLLTWRPLFLLLTI